MILLLHRLGKWQHVKDTYEIGEGKLFSPGNLRATFDNPAYDKVFRKLLSPGNFYFCLALGIWDGGAVMNWAWTSCYIPVLDFPLSILACGLTMLLLEA